jgi:hypothetical protein
MRGRFVKAPVSFGIGRPLRRGDWRYYEYGKKTLQTRAKQRIRERDQIDNWWNKMLTQQLEK